MTSPSSPQIHQQSISLDAATSLAGDDGNFEIELSDRWQLWGPSGGYLSAIALRAAGELSELSRPVSFYCHFLKSPKFASAQVTAAFERAGKRSESISVQIMQGGEIVLTALVRTSGDTTGHSHDVTSLPTDKMPDDVEPFRFSGPGSEMFTFWDHVERRPVLKISNSTSRDPICREWFRFHPTAKFKDPFLDAARPLMMLDTFGYRAARQKYPDHTLFAPNLDTSAWFHDIEAQTDWMLIEHTNPVARDGVMFVDGRVWSESGKLVAGGSAQLLQLERN
ncbi:MAG: thioesterase family protein [Solirubrobacterales bacterium]